MILEFIFRRPASESARSGHLLSRGGFTGIVRIDILEQKLLAAGDAIRRYKLLGPFDVVFIFHLFGYPIAPDWEPPPTLVSETAR